MENFTIKDCLRHRAFSFPKTVLNFQKTGEMPNGETDVLLVNGVETPYEINPKNNGYILKTIADLPYNSKRDFTFKKGKNSFSPLENDNGKIGVKSENGGLYAVDAFGAEFKYSVNTSLKLLSEIEETSGGSVESVFTKILTYEGGKEYKFTLKLKRDLDYLEIYEEMKGFTCGEARLVLTWNDFAPTHRYTTIRGTEKIDDYVDENGKLPFVVNPFMPCNSMWDRPLIAYTEKGKTEWLGILLHDYKHFDDEEYAIWGSHDTLALVPYENKLEGEIRCGKRAFMQILCEDRPVGEISTYYARYYSAANLDKVKDYVLDWEDDKNEYPKYFSVKKDLRWGGFYGDYVGKPAAEDMMNILDRDATIFTAPETPGPVSCRAYRSSWAQVFDLTANELTDDEFKRVRAAMAFVCYTYADENYYPIENMLAGHPNFLTDVLGTIAVFAALLGKNHPMHDKWLAYYEKGIARNFKYHLRPEVEKWQAEGGRWTENVGCYMMGMLYCVINDCHIVYALNGGEMPMLYSHIKPFLKFLVNIASPENEYGRRLYPPMGAHAATGEFGGNFGHGFALEMLKLADMIENYEPTISEQIRHNFRNPADVDGVIRQAGILGESYRRFAKYNNGTSPKLHSSKYTGLGFMLRSHENTSREAEVFLQQIDDGPNYRWGRAAQGGCGEIYYYADGKKYTDHNPEDVGDETRGDVQAATNFGVLIDREYRSVGRNDLTEPLMDFGFVKYARVNAGKYSAPYYKYRSLMMIENRYIAVYDAVADKFQVGRFVWAQKGDGEFPMIKNIRPGVSGVLSDGGVPLDEFSNRYKKNDTKTLNFDGRGDFLTVVTHLRGYNDERAIYSIDQKEYGAELVFPQNKEEVFFDGARIREENESFSFDGYVGYFTRAKGEIRLAVFDGNEIGCREILLKIPHDKQNRYGMSAVLRGGEICGDACFSANGTVKIRTPNCGKAYIDGAEVEFSYKDGEYTFEMPCGNHSYNIGEIATVNKAEITGSVARKGGFTLEWKPTAKEYEIALSDDGEYTYKSIGRTSENSFTASGLTNAKYHVRVRASIGGKTGEWSHAYPVYVTEEKPHCPNGLRVLKTENGFIAEWGEVLGCGEYRLYKVGDKTPIYIGKERQAEVSDGEYFVTAVNGNGESAPSLVRSAKSELATWDNHPEKGFVRDPRSNEHGYRGFDYIGNKKLFDLVAGKYEK